MFSNVGGRYNVLEIAFVVILVFLATAGLAICQMVQDFEITKPITNVREWNGRVIGRGCRPDHTVEVFIRTDTDYSQGYVPCGRSSSWLLTQTYPTRGTINKVYAILYSPDGTKVARSNTVVVDLRGAQLNEGSSYIEVEDLTQWYSPKDIVNYFIRGHYARVRIRVAVEGVRDDLIESVEVYIKAQSEGRDYQFQPRALIERVRLKRVKPGVFEREYIAQTLAPTLEILSSFAGISGQALSSGASLLELTPPLAVEEIVLVGRNGDTVRRSVYEPIPLFIERLSPSDARNHIREF